MGSTLRVYPVGSKGNNLDEDPISLDDQELTKSQNVSRDPIDNGLRKRPGLLAANSNLAAGAILGGIGVPIINLSEGGTLVIYLGRGPL